MKKALVLIVGLVGILALAGCDEKSPSREVIACASAIKALDAPMKCVGDIEGIKNMKNITLVKLYHNGWKIDSLIPGVDAIGMGTGFSFVLSKIAQNGIEKDNAGATEAKESPSSSPSYDRSYTPEPMPYTK